MKKKTVVIGKKELTDKISKRIRLTKAQIEGVIDELLKEIQNSLVKGEEVRFLRYFSFKTAEQKARMAINLQTKKKMKVPAKLVPKVKFSDGLKKEVASKRKV